ncbi:MAG: HDIG domain-containing protein [Desulfobacteraceae bacterium]|nr:HDIG domain-containing protein [Desulfobacteraceae bacterium]
MKKTKINTRLKLTKEYLLSTPHLLWFILIFITVSFTISQAPDRSQVSYSYQIGDVAQRDIKAPKKFFIEDKDVTNARKKQIKELVKTVYDFDDSLLTDISLHVEAAMEFARQLFKKPQNSNTPDPTFAMALTTKPEFEKKIGIKISDEGFNILYKHRFSANITNKIKTILNKILSNGVVGNKNLLLTEEKKGINLRTITSHNEQTINNLKTVYGPDQAKTMVRIEGQPLLEKLNHNLSNLIVDICQRLLQPNITLNKNETEKRILEAQSKINPILYQIKAGEMIIREGERVDKIKLIKLTTLKEQIVKKNTYMASIGTAMITCFLILVVYYLFLKDHKRLKNNHNTHMIFLAFGLILYLFFTKIVIYIARLSHPEMAWELAASSFYTIVPIQAATMITCLFLGFDIAIFFTIVLSVLVSLAFGGSLQVFIFFFFSSITAAYWINERQERKNFIIAGFKLAIFNSIFAIALGFYSLSHPTPMLLAKEVIFAFCGGLLAATLTVGFTPLIEVFFNYTTAAKLLEFSNLEQPLIKKLMIEAPGTYNHSVIVATLAEAAASAAEANGLQAKVMGYYHDIGKLDKTMYFIENQADGKNRHDKLSPSMSALILIQHVKKGVEMAKAHKLGNEIIEGILQHHGTSLIKYFYNKSLSSGNDKVNEADFRYPGPKPQTREAGIVMLADVVEAAVRALERPTPSRIQGRVKELISDIFADGQLEECELTLKDLHQIAKSFNKILTSIYHSRIEYTDKTQEKKKEKNGTTKDSDRQSAKSENPNAPNIAKDRTDLKRLGL